MSQPPVVLDTNVASFVEGRRTEAALYEPDLRGRRLLLSFQSVAELRFGADNGGWRTRRRRELSEFISQHTVLYPTAATCETWGISRQRSSALV